jgi:hypothetical protein
MKKNLKPLVDSNQRPTVQESTYYPTELLNSADYKVVNIHYSSNGSKGSQSL